MVTLRSILCAVDFSEQSRDALRWAEALARRHQSRLIVLSAVDPLLAEAARARFGLDLARAETEPALREFVAATWPDAAEPRAHTVFDVRVGDPSDVILETAARERPDLIALGTHGLSGVRKWILGSTTERVLRRTHTPVLAVPAAAPDAVRHVSAAPLVPGLILAATDLSDTSLRAVQWAAELAQELDAPLLVAHVVEPVIVAPRWRSYVDEADTARVAAARARLEPLVRQVCGAQPCETVVSLGRPADSIASIVEERRAGLIVMGLASASGPFAPRPGSIAYRVLSLASVPVLVVPPQSARAGGDLDRDDAATIVRN